MKTALIVTALVALGLYGMGLGLLVLLQRRFIYVPDKNLPDLAAAGIPKAREITVHTRDGLDLFAWLIQPDDETQPVILCLHGNAGHIGNRASWMTRLHGYGWGVLLLEYRGYGGNPGEPTESGLIEDARAGYAELRGIGIPGHRILLWGDSLGTGVAVRLATEVEVGAVMLESPYTSMVAIGQKRFPFAPVAWLLRDRFDSIGRIPMVRAPVLVMTGGRDEVVPPDMGRAVFAAAPEPKVFWLAPDAGHEDLAEAGAFDVVRKFVQEHWKVML